MLHQRRLDLERRDVDAAHLQHVVAAAGSRCSSRRRRARTCRRSWSSRPGRSRATSRGCPSTSAAALGPLDVEVADLAVGDRPAVFAAQLDLVAGRPACRWCRSGRRRAGSRGRCAASRSSRCRRRCRSRSGARSARRSRAAAPRRPTSTGAARPPRAPAAPATASMPAKPVGAPKKTVGDAVPVPRRGCAGPALEDRIGRRPLRHQHHGRADREREAQRVAEAVGEVELGGGEADVVARSGRAPACRTARPSTRLGVGVDRALGLAGRARRIEPEGRIVATGRGGFGERLAGAVEQRIEVERAGRQRRGGAGDDQVADLVCAWPSPCRAAARARPRRSPPGPGCARACRRSRRR